MKNLWNHRLFLLVIALATSLVYSNVLHGDPQFDDEQYVFDLPLHQSPHAFKNLDWFESFRSGQRPVTAFTFALNYYFWGKDTFSYHLTNLFIHLINGVLVYILVYMTLQRAGSMAHGARSIEHRAWSEGQKGNAMPYALCTMHTNAGWIAFLTALIFSIHPVQTESVSYIVQRGESMASMFYLASLLAFVMADKSRRIRKVFYSTLFVAAFFLGLGSKQIAVTLPVTAFLYGICFFDRKGIWKRIALPCLLILVGIVASAFAILSIGKGLSAGYYLREFTVWEYMLTQLRVVVTYLRMLLLPVGQSIDHLYPVNRSFREIPALTSFFFILSLLTLALFLYRRWRAGSFFILWFFIILLPSSSIVPLRDLFVEHRVYLASVGFFFILASALVKLAEALNRRSNGMVLVAACLIITLLSGSLWAATYSRNNIWKSRLAMWQDVVKKYPKNARGHSNLGNCYFIKKDYKNALKEYLISLNLNISNIELYHNIGRIFESFGMRGLAKGFFTLFIKSSPGSYGKISEELAARYGIAEETPVPDIMKLKNRAVDVYVRFYGAGR